MALLHVIGLAVRKRARTLQLLRGFCDAAPGLTRGAAGHTVRHAAGRYIFFDTEEA